MTMAPDRAPATPAARRKVYVVAAVVALVGLLAAGGMLALINSGGELGRPLTPGEPVTVHVATSDKTVIWARDSGEPLPDMECALSPEPQGSGWTRAYLNGLHLDVDGDRWAGLLVISAEPAGTYEVTCLTSGANTPALSIGEVGRFQSLRSQALLGIGAFSTAVATVISVGLLLLLPALRRRRQRARLRQSA